MVVPRPNRMVDDSGQADSARTDTMNKKWFCYRALVILVLWIVYSGTVTTTVYYAYQDDFFVNVTTRTLLNNTVPVFFTLMCHSATFVFQLFFVVFCAISTLTRLKVPRIPMTAIAIDILALLAAFSLALTTHFDVKIPSIVLSLASSAMFCICLAIILKSTYKSDFAPIRFVGHNPMALGACVMFLRCMYHLAVVLNDEGVDFDLIKTLIASIILGVLVVVVILDFGVFRKYTMFIPSQYAPPTWGSIRTITIVWKHGHYSVYIIIAIACISCLCFTTKIVRNICAICANRKAKTKKKQERKAEKKANPNYGATIANEEIPDSVQYPPAVSDDNVKIIVGRPEMNEEEKGSKNPGYDANEITKF